MTALAWVCAGAVSCVADRYIIGSYDGGGVGPGTGSGGAGGAGGSGDAAGGGGAAAAACSAGGSCRFSVDMDHDGVSFLPDTLALPSGALAAALRYRGDRADVDGWHADRGPLLAAAAGVAQRELGTPFTDATLAVGLATGAPSYSAPTADSGAVDAGDFLVELVFRAAPGAPIVAKGTASTGWALGIDGTGALVLSVGDGALAVQTPSEVLAARAWYHCLAWVSHGQGARVDCDGRPGTAHDLAGVGALSAASPLSVGGAVSGAMGGVQLALLQLFVAAPGALGDATGWQAISRQRFATLTGVFPRLATGTALPREGLRNSLAYVDIQHESGGPRRLFLVGPDWPRIACRTDVVGTWDCGYLAEPARGQAVDADPAKWTAGELSVAAGTIVFVDGDQTMSGLIPSTKAASHTLIRHASFSGPRQSLSFFAHAGAGHLLGVSVAAHGQAVFDVEAGTIVSPPSDAGPSIEDWGHGIFRCVYTFPVEAGALDYRLTLLNDAGADAFAGDGASAWVSVAGLQLDANEAYAATLLAGAKQAADHLTYAADDGNLPNGVAALQLRVLLPLGPRLTDQALVNINRGGTNSDQIDLFLGGNTGAFEFSGISGGQSSWNFKHPTPAVDGVRHTVEAQWGGAREQVLVDGVAASMGASKSTPPPTVMDRIDIGFSASSGILQGLQAGLQIRSP